MPRPHRRQRAGRTRLHEAEQEQCRGDRLVTAQHTEWCRTKKLEKHLTNESLRYVYSSLADFYPTLESSSKDNQQGGELTCMHAQSQRGQEQGSLTAEAHSHRQLPGQDPHLRPTGQTIGQERGIHLLGPMPLWWSLTPLSPGRTSIPCTGRCPDGPRSTERWDRATASAPAHMALVPYTGLP